MNTPRHVIRNRLHSTLVNNVTAQEDAVHLRSGSVRRCFIKPVLSIPLSTGHMDGVQIIPDTVLSPYALPYLDSFEVTQTVVDGETTPIQCCFASDGVFGFANISDNTFRTSGQHFISVNGLLSGKINGNEFSAGADSPIKLYPARPGGNPDGKYNVWVLHFKDDYFKYQPIECDTPELMQDFRQSVFNSTDKFLIQFDYAKFESLSAQVPNAGGRVMGREFQRIALLCGELVTEYSPVRVSNMYELSKQGRDVLIESEGIELGVYLDSGNHETIGIGHKVTDAEKETGVLMIGKIGHAFYEQPLSTKDAYLLFAQDIKQREASLNAKFEAAGVVLTQHQFDALFNFYYNIGHGRFFGSSTREPSTVWTRLQAADFDRVPDAIRMWNKSKGKISKGLVARRERTINLWEGLSWVDEVSPPPVAPFKPAPAKEQPKLVTKVEPEVHETELHSTTMQGILGAVVSSLLTYVVSKGWFDETIALAVQPYVLEGIGVAGTLIGAWWARRGRKKAVKGFKK